MTGTIQRVLVVDDSRLQRRILVASLKKWGFEVVEADSGESAMEICREEAPDLILSDWMMPGMNGIEFCRNLRKMNSDNYSYFILLTSKSEKNEIAEGLHSGADDFLTKPVSSDELRARISAGERILRMQRELSEKNRIVSETLDELQRVYDAIDKDLMQARKIQESLVPELSRVYGESKVSLLLKPCGHIGGDLVGMFSPGVNRLGFYSIDVSGHGITSAMMTARLGGYLSSSHFDQNVAMEQRFNRYYALKPPEDVASILNARLIADTGIEEYFTMAYCTVDLRSGLLKLVQAGHPHPLLLRKDGTMEYIGQGGVPVGLVPDIEYTREEVVLEQGDRLLLYSDGFTEARLENGEMLEDEGLMDLVRKCDTGQGGQEFLDELYWNLTQVMSKEHGLEDDVSATLFEYNGA
ncbi:SpoIIE family protein phosphatase [Epibacterium sp. SM1969]|uniref:SpoIIE family protein phosphatase n=1 Tax=Tritonibacter aquimaris TaxID=2663379 RepID=A0A844AK24_9RHOB|nr:fused response regulator/phosphatase [Tritonibacter aquimaris]MQY41880.1 SpoIIE family protein phosphatase [Tritonibacter aquimaris]